MDTTERDQSGASGHLQVYFWTPGSPLYPSLNTTHAASPFLETESLPFAMSLVQALIVSFKLQYPYLKTWATQIVYCSRGQKPVHIAISGIPTDHAILSQAQLNTEEYISSKD